MDNVKTESFVKLLLSNERDLYGYTYSLLPHAEDAREVVQDAAIVMWQHFDEYDPGRPFFPWASRFIYFGVLTQRKRKQRAAKLLSEAAIAAVASEYRDHPDQTNAPIEHLPECIKKLPTPARKLLEQRYRDGKTVQEIAAETGRNVYTLYKALDRLRQWLLECIQQGIAAEEQP